MQRGSSTRDSSRRSNIQNPDYWEVSNKNSFIRLELQPNGLKVQALSIFDFKYYVGLFPIAKEGEEQLQRVSPALVNGLSNLYHQIELKEGRLMVNLPGNFSRYEKEYQFPKLKELPLSSDLVDEIEYKRRLLSKEALDIYSTKTKISFLENEKRAVTKELKRTTRQLLQAQRQIQELKSSRFDDLYDYLRISRQNCGRSLRKAWNNAEQQHLMCAFWIILLIAVLFWIL